MDIIEDRLDLLQRQIELTTDPMTRANLFLKKVELLKLQKSNNKINYKEVIDQSEKSNNKINYKEVIDQLERDIKEKM